MPSSKVDSRHDAKLKQLQLAQAKFEAAAELVKAAGEFIHGEDESKLAAVIADCRAAQTEALAALDALAGAPAPKPTSAAAKRPRRCRRCCGCCCCCCKGCGLLMLVLGLAIVPEVFQYVLYYHAVSVTKPGPVASRLPGLTPRTWDEAYELAGATLGEMTLEEKHSLIEGGAWTVVSVVTSPIGPKPGYYTGNTPAIPRLGIPALKMQDAANGFRPTTDVPAGSSTCWPSLLALAATWDDALVEEVARDIGVEFRGKGANVILGPSVQVHRTAWGGRNFEYLAGDDPYLGARLTRAYVRGVQGEGLIAVAKHFAMNEQELNRMSNSVHMKDERVAWELYYPPFEAAIEEGVCAFMCAYNGVNGTPSCQNKELLTRDLRERMGFKGFVQSDWFANYWSSSSVLAGLDQEMPGIERAFTLSKIGKFYQDPVEGARYKWAVDNATLRILATVYRMRLDETADTSCDPPRCIEERISNQRTSQHRQRAAEAATKSVVLLKNDGVLPFNRSTVKRLAVVGKAADAPLVDPFYFAYMGGGSGTVWPGSVVTPLQGITRRAAREGIEVVSSLTWDENEVLKLVFETDPDVLIIVDAVSSTEGFDRDSPSGPPHLTADLQTLACPELTKAMLNAGRKVVVLLQTPGAVLMPWLPNVHGVLQLFLAGEETGTAWANILFGDASPEGKLPVMFPLTAADAIRPNPNASFSYDEGLFTSYRNPKARAAFPFGHGLSYTHFVYGPASTARGRRCLAAVACARLNVTNAGDRPGAEVVQAYLEFESAKNTPARILRGYSKTRVLKPGETQEAWFTFSRRDLSIYVVGPGWTVQDDVKVHFGSSSADIRQVLQLRRSSVAASLPNTL